LDEIEVSILQIADASHQSWIVIFAKPKTVYREVILQLERFKLILHGLFSTSIQTI
jgi:hypothetical protein